jgi:hypothetical protein
MTEPIIKDFDAVAPKKRKARIGGKEISIGIIPGRMILDVARFMDEKASGKMSTVDQVTRIVDLVSGIVSKEDPEITADWLLENASMDTLVEFCSWVITPVNKEAEKYQEQRGNSKTAK